MDIGVPVKDLGEIDVGPLRDAILGIDGQAWLENNHRQTEYDVHAARDAIKNSRVAAISCRRYVVWNLSWFSTQNPQTIP